MTNIEIILLILIIACFSFTCAAIVRVHFIKKDNDDLRNGLYNEIQRDLYVLRKGIQSKPQEQTQPDDPDPRHKKLSQDDLDHWKQVYDYQMEAIKDNPITKEAIDKVLKREHHFIYDEVVETTIKDCINLLSTDGKGTKQQVKQKLEELIK